MKAHIDIHKAGGVILKDRRFLVTRSTGKDIFIAPGGKLEEKESAVQALVREMKEEVCITINTSTLESLGTFIALAAEKEDVWIQMAVFIIHNYEGQLEPANEVEEIKWINTQTENVSLGSIFKHDIMPLLKQRNLID